MIYEIYSIKRKDFQKEKDHHIHPSQASYVSSKSAVV